MGVKAEGGSCLTVGVQCSLKLMCIAPCQGSDAVGGFIGEGPKVLSVLQDGLTEQEVQWEKEGRNEDSWKLALQRL